MYSLYTCFYAGQGYKQLKAKLGMKKVRPWKWMPFTNPARKDGAVFHHWRRVADEGKEYPFAKFNKVTCEILSMNFNADAYLYWKSFLCVCVCV